jgi:ADP-heptose:LPS heptosyltransferase
MIVISPYSKKLRNGKENPKNYPYWKQLISQIDEKIVQVGVTGEEQLVEDFRTNLSLSDLKNLIEECRIWISVDSFFQHYAWELKKYGIVLWGQSDPLIYGHPENINLFKDRSFLAKNQFLHWENYDYRSDCFVDTSIVLSYLKDK